MLSIEKRIREEIDAEELCGPEAPGNSIDVQVDEKMKDLDLIYKKFQTIEGCDCPLCRAIKAFEPRQQLRKRNTDGS
jgi:hypothetical protein